MYLISRLILFNNVMFAIDVSQITNFYRYFYYLWFIINHRCMNSIVSTTSWQKATYNWMSSRISIFSHSGWTPAIDLTYSWQETQENHITMSHVRTIQTIIAQVGVPFRPKYDPSRNLAEEIEVRNTTNIRKHEIWPETHVIRIKTDWTPIFSFVYWVVM